jgi:hypothetical protein
MPLPRESGKPGSCRRGPSRSTPGIAPPYRRRKGKLRPPRCSVSQPPTSSSRPAGAVPGPGTPGSCSALPAGASATIRRRSRAVEGKSRGQLRCPAPSLYSARPPNGRTPTGACGFTARRKRNRETGGPAQFPGGVPFSTEFSQPSSEPDFAARGPRQPPAGVESNPAAPWAWHPGTASASLVDLFRTALSEESWDVFSRGSALRIARREGFARSVAVALGNWGDPSAVPGADARAEGPRSAGPAHPARSLHPAPLPSAQPAPRHAPAERDRARPHAPAQPRHSPLLRHRLALAAGYSSPIPQLRSTPNSRAERCGRQTRRC